MNTLKADFQDRIHDLRSYLAVVKACESDPAMTANSEVGLKSMKAATHLLMYNLVEFTASGIHQAIFDAIEVSGTDFDSLSLELQRVVLLNARRPDVRNLLPLLSRLSYDLMNASFDRDNIFSGNVDARKIRESFRNLGLKEPRPRGRQASQGGDFLLAIKENRNQLAHGRRTFSQVGRDLTADDLIDQLNCVESYLLHCIDIADSFISKGRYRRVV